MSRLLASIVVVVITTLACTPAGNEGEGEGEGEAECDADAACPRLGQACLDGHCFDASTRCDGDDVVTTARRTVLEPATLDCAIWDATCVPGAGCVLPRGAACVPFSSCEASGGSQACVDGRCPTGDLDDHARLDAPTLVTLPSRTSLVLSVDDLDCVTTTIPSGTAPKAVSVTFDPLVSTPVYFFQGERVADTGGLALVETGPVQVCAQYRLSADEPTVATTMLLEVIDLPDERVRDFCVDTRTLSVNGAESVCAADALCTHRGGVAACRSSVGATCSVEVATCAGVCARDVDGASVCSDEAVSTIDDAGICRDGRYFRAYNEPSFLISSIDDCGDADCEHRFGCVHEPGEACLPEQWCRVGDDLEPCVDGFCPTP